MLICPECLQRLPWPGTCCPVCAAPANDDAPCGRCLGDPPAFERAYAAFRYAPPMDHLIRELKFGHRLANARPLGELLARFVQARGATLPDMIVPVPVHAKRLKRRGFNQAHEIAKITGSHLGCTVNTLNMTRVGPHQPQTALPKKQRLKLPLKFFSLTRPPPDHVALVDDVITTGATARAVARVLERAGAKRIDVWAVARTQLPSYN